MYKTIYAVINYKDFGEKNESKKVLLVTTDFDEANKIFDSEYIQSYNPSAILAGGENIARCFYRGEMWNFFVALEEVGWIDENGKHYNVDGLGNPIV